MTPRPTRAALLVASTAAVVLGVGALPALSGRDPALAVLRARSADREPDPAALAAVRVELGLDRSTAVRTLDWVRDLVHGDLGTSWVSGRPVTDGLGSALGVSLTLTLFAAGVAVVTALALSAGEVRTALRTPHRVRGRAVRGVVAAAPEFVLAVVAVAVVAVRWGWLPTSGWSGPRSAVLPALSLGVPAGAVLGVVLGGATAAALREPWVRTWRAAGLRERTVAGAAVRRGASAAAEQLVLLVAGLLGGAVAVEAVFDVPGIGRAAHGAALTQDVPVVQACVLVLLGVGLALGALGAPVQRRLLGPALADGALGTPPPPPPGRGRVAVVLLALGLLVVAGGLLRDPQAVDQTRRLRAPGPAAPLGTDAAGRDLWARLAHGALPTVGTAVVVTAAALAVAVVVALASRSAEVPVPALVATAVPAVLVGVVVVGVRGPGPLGAALAVGAVAWAPLAVHLRSVLVEERAAVHLQAARAAGAGPWWVLRRHLLPAVAAPVLAHALVRLPGVALALAALGFLGLGSAPPSPEWGLLLADGLTHAERAPWAVAVPAVGLLWLGAVSAAAPAAGPGRGRGGRSWRPRRRADGERSWSARPGRVKIVT